MAAGCTLLRDGIICGIPERTEFVSTLMGIDLGPLHGMTRRRRDQPVHPRTASARSEALAWLFGPPVRQPVVRKLAALEFAHFQWWEVLQVALLQFRVQLRVRRGFSCSLGTGVNLNKGLSVAWKWTSVV